MEVLKLSGKMKVIDIKPIFSPRVSNLLEEKLEKFTPADLVRSLELALKQELGLI